jgi:hypothetical protein
LTHELDETLAVETYTTLVAALEALLGEINQHMLPEDMRGTRPHDLIKRNYFRFYKLYSTAALTEHLGLPHALLMRANKLKIFVVLSWSGSLHVGKLGANDAAVAGMEGVVLDRESSPLCCPTQSLPRIRRVKCGAVLANVWGVGA